MHYFTFLPKNIIARIQKKCPFFKNGKIVDFKLRPLHDICCIWPYYESIDTIIELPETIQKEYYKGIGVLLAVGPGWWGRNPKYRSCGKWIDPGPKEYWHPTSTQLIPGVVILHDKYIPWRTYISSPSGKEEQIILCSTADIYGVFE